MTNLSEEDGASEYKEEDVLTPPNGEDNRREHQVLDETDIDQKKLSQVNISLTSQSVDPAE